MPKNMLREQIKKEIDQLSDQQLQKIADFMVATKLTTAASQRGTPLWQKMTPEERARDFREWVSQLTVNSPSLSDIDISRDSIYE